MYSQKLMISANTEETIIAFLPCPNEQCTIHCIRICIHHHMISQSRYIRWPTSTISFCSLRTASRPLIRRFTSSSLVVSSANFPFILLTVLYNGSVIAFETPFSSDVKIDSCYKSLSWASFMSIMNSSLYYANVTMNFDQQEAQPKLDESLIRPFFSDFDTFWTKTEFTWNSCENILIL